MMQSITINVSSDEIADLARTKFVTEMADLNADHRFDHYMYEDLMKKFTVCDIIWQDTSIDVVLEKDER